MLDKADCVATATLYHQLALRDGVRFFGHAGHRWLSVSATARVALRCHRLCADRDRAYCPHKDDPDTLKVPKYDADFTRVTVTVEQRTAGRCRTSFLPCNV